MIWTFPQDLIFAFSVTMISLIFILLPIKLIKSGLPRMIFFMAPLLGVIAYYSGTLSRMGTLTPQLSHCGSMSYTGLMYPLHEILTDAHQDDLEARNQLCWVRKMITRVPEKSDAEFLKLTIKKLQMPERKYRAALPLIAFLQGYMMVSLENSTWGRVQTGKDFLDSLQYWRDLYAIEISAREYAWYDWPFSVWIKYEYGLIENNWQAIIDGITFEEGP